MRKIHLRDTDSNEREQFYEKLVQSVQMDCARKIQKTTTAFCSVILNNRCLEIWVAKSRTRLSDFTFTSHFHALEKEMATHSSVLAWRIPGTGKPGGLPSMGSHRVGHNWSDLAAAAAEIWVTALGRNIKTFMHDMWGKQRIGISSSGWKHRNGWQVLDLGLFPTQWVICSDSLQ